MRAPAGGGINLHLIGIIPYIFAAGLLLPVPAGCFSPPSPATDGSSTTSAASSTSTVTSSSGEETSTQSTSTSSTDSSICEEGSAGNCLSSEGTSFLEESSSDAASETSSTPDCEIGDEQSCWETPNGIPLPEMMGPLLGDCRLGTRRCLDDGSWGSCVGAAAPADFDSCEVAGADNNCNGIPNESCSCTGNETRECGTAVGNCELGLQTCDGNAWGPCEGGTVPQEYDSCSEVGDDANCNDGQNDGCPCVGDESRACADCATQACDPENRQWGECVVQSSFCTIDGVCFGHGAQNPNNPCQICDSTINVTAWTNAQSGTRCDDGVFCNGSDSCSASAQCQHEFPAGDRCRGNGPCDRSSCDTAAEQARSCFLPTTTVCDETTEGNCSPGSVCGAAAQRREVSQYCTGTASACTGARVPQTAFQTIDQCAANETCTDSGETATCAPTLECAAYCDPSTDLCWDYGISDDPLSYSVAEDYCEDLTVGGATHWRLPTLNEWFGIFRGCDDGTRGGANVLSACEFSPSCDAPVCDPAMTFPATCRACTDGQGPDQGCYWVPELDGEESCEPFQIQAFWSRTYSTGTAHWQAIPGSGTVNQYGEGFLQLYARCVAER